MTFHDLIFTVACAAVAWHVFRVAASLFGPSARRRWQAEFDAMFDPKELEPSVPSEPGVPTLPWPLSSDDFFSLRKRIGMAEAPEREKREIVRRGRNYHVYRDEDGYKRLSGPYREPTRAEIDDLCRSNGGEPGRFSGPQPLSPLRNVPFDPIESDVEMPPLDRIR